MDQQAKMTRMEICRGCGCEYEASTSDNSDGYCSTGCEKANEDIVDELFNSVEEALELDKQLVKTAIELAHLAGLKQGLTETANAD